MTSKRPAPGPDGAHSPRGGQSWPLPRRRELFADPQAKVIWPAILALPEPTQHDLLRELQLRLAVPQYRDSPQRVREARAIAALMEAHDMLYAERVEQAEPGEPVEPITTLALTVDDFDRFARLHPERGWPPRSTLISWLGGSWGSALRAARLPAAPGGDAVRVRNGEDFTEAEAYAALHECARDYGHVPSLTEYRRWANTEEVLARQGRRPRSQYAFVRLAGSWQKALEASGLLGMESSGPVQHTGSYRPAAYRFTPEQLRAALREVADRLGHSPRSTEYTRMRDILQREEERAGRPVIARPSYNVYNRVYDSWDDALVDAGLTPLGGRATMRGCRRQPAPEKWTDQELWAALERCVADFNGDYVPARFYMAWRKRQTDMRAIPSYDTIRDRLCGEGSEWGRWEKLITAVCEQFAKSQQPDNDSASDKREADGGR
jgi:hypothetical protein